MRVSSLALLLLIVGAGSLPALADTYVYTYTGNDFSYVENPFAAGDFVSGELTLSAPLPANENNGFPDSSLVSFSFSDGVDTITNVTDPSPGELSVTTDASGNIIGWTILFNALDDGGIPGGPYTVDSIITTYSNAPNATQDYGASGIPFGGAYVNDDPGIWTLTVIPDAAAAPEPGSLAMLSTGLLGIAGLMRRRFGRPFAG